MCLLFYCQYCRYLQVIFESLFFACEVFVAHPSEAEDHPAVLVEIHTVVLVGVQVLEDLVHCPLVVAFLWQRCSQLSDIKPFVTAVVKHSLERGLFRRSEREVAHPQQLSQFILKKLLQLCLAQGVGVPLSACIFTEGLDEEGHGFTHVRHGGNC